MRLDAKVCALAAGLFWKLGPAGKRGSGPGCLAGATRARSQGGVPLRRRNRPSREVGRAWAFAVRGRLARRLWESADG
jgi:hypothetical protein